MFRIAPTAFLTLRNEFYNDIVGSRTGHATKYSEHSLGVTWWPNKIITLRPELRFDHSHDTAAFNNGTETSLSDQWTSSFTTNDPDEG
ncbi:MAG: outer membrane beta-barrel protein [Chthoniobacterales bacterium]